MENEFNIREEGKILFIYAGYELTSVSVPKLQEELKQYEGHDIERIVFDVTDLTYISSSGIRMITYVQQKIGHSSKIEFLNCDKRIYDTLDIVGMTSFFIFEEDERMNKAVAPNKAGAEWQKKADNAKQKMLDHFAAQNDVVVYQMKLGHTED
jgi:anti-anti-sigma factor